MGKTEIATTTSGFLKLHDFNMSAAMAEELDGLNVNFERIKIPAGGSTVFELPTSENVEKVVVEEATIEDGKEPLLVYREAAKKA